jgi:hypothetical protein
VQGQIHIPLGVDIQERLQAAAHNPSGVDIRERLQAAAHIRKKAHIREAVGSKPRSANTCGHMDQDGNPPDKDMARTRSRLAR